MNITDFEEYFSPRILERGKEYYRNHHVITLDRIEEGYYEAEVEGSQIYTVFVELEENGEISDISCDCPYDWEEFCKHEAAVLYALREQEEYTPFVEEPEQKQTLIDMFPSPCGVWVVSAILYKSRNGVDFAVVLYV